MQNRSGFCKQKKGFESAKGQEGVFQPVKHLASLPVFLEGTLCSVALIEVKETPIYFRPPFGEKPAQFWLAGLVGQKVSGRRTCFAPLSDRPGPGASCRTPEAGFQGVHRILGPPQEFPFENQPKEGSPKKDKPASQVFGLLLLLSWDRFSKQGVKTKTSRKPKVLGSLMCQNRGATWQFLLLVLL